MKRIFSLLMTLLLLASLPLSVHAAEPTHFTVWTPGDGSVQYTGSEEKDAFPLAVGYVLADDSMGLSGYALTIRWDPTVLKLRTDFRSDMTDAEMLNCRGCYFSDPYDCGLNVAPAGMTAVNYRSVEDGILTLISADATDKPDTEAFLFVLDLIPLCDNVNTVVSVSVIPQLGISSATGLITEYVADTSYVVRIGSAKLYGDADGNGAVDAADLLKIRTLATQNEEPSEQERKLADINGDGKVNAIDYLLVRRIVTV